MNQAKLQSKAASEQKAVAAEQLNNNVQAAHTNYLQSYVELETQQKNVQLAQQNYEELNEVDARINIAYAYYKMKYITGQL